MINEEFLADAGAGVNLDSSYCAPQVGYEARGYPESPLVQGVGEAVDLTCVETGVSQDDFEVACRGRIALPRRLDVSSNAV
jgi:hypothetical protein